MVSGGRLWGLFGWLALLFYLAGVAEYMMVRFSFAPYMLLLTLDQQAWLADLPLWADTLWAISVWAGLLGGVLMVSRTEGGVVALAFAALAMAALAVYLIAFAVPSMSDLGGPIADGLMIGAAIIAGALWLISHRLKRRGG